MIMMIYAKIKNFSLNLVPLIFIVFTSTFNVQAQSYSIDKPPQRKLQFHIHFKSGEQAKAERVQKKAARKKNKDMNKASRNEIKSVKKYWKHVDHPKELGTKRKVVKRMRKDLRVANRINHNKHKEGFIKRLSKIKIKLPKISMTKIHWPWMKKTSTD